MSIAPSDFTLPSMPALDGQWLRPLREHWSTASCACLCQETTVVRVLLAAKRGSAPREAGACMLVMRERIQGTIGGGHLEWQAIQSARTLLTDTKTRSVQLQRLILGKELAQCCGGEVYVWLERFTRADLPLLRRLSRAARAGSAILIKTQCQGEAITRQVLRPGTTEHDALQQHFATPSLLDTTRLLNTDNNAATLLERLERSNATLWLYGAGHVGQALIRVLAEQPFDITWIDTRVGFLPDGLPANVRAVHSDTALELVRSAPSAAHHRVLTHDHGLDYVLCHELLLRGEFASVGLIGSNSKGARFRAQLKRDGVPLDRIAQLICPIGIEGIASKLPAAIALGIAAQLLQQVAGATPSSQEAPIAEACGSDSCASCHTKRAAP